MKIIDLIVKSLEGESSDISLKEKIDIINGYRTGDKIGDQVGYNEGYDVENDDSFIKKILNNKRIKKEIKKGENAYTYGLRKGFYAGYKKGRIEGYRRKVDEGRAKRNAEREKDPGLKVVHVNITKKDKSEKNENIRKKENIRK